MGLFKLVHDIMGIDRRRMTGSIKNVAKSVSNQRDRLRKCEKVRRMRIK